MATTDVGRLLLAHPALADAGGSGLHTTIRTAWTRIGDHMAGRYFEASAVADSTLTTFEHNYDMTLSDLSYQLFTGTGASKVRVPDPGVSGWTIAANGGDALGSIDVTTPGSGGPHDFTIILLGVGDILTRDAQTITGNKTFSGNVIANANVTLNNASAVLTMSGATSAIKVNRISDEAGSGPVSFLDNLLTTNTTVSATWTIGGTASTSKDIVFTRFGDIVVAKIITMLVTPGIAANKAIWNGVVPVEYRPSVLIRTGTAVTAINATTQSIPGIFGITTGGVIEYFASSGISTVNFGTGANNGFSDNASLCWSVS